jgi:hypothetical protein
MPDMGRGPASPRGGFSLSFPTPTRQVGTADDATTGGSCGREETRAVMILSKCANSLGLQVQIDIAREFFRQG